MQTGRSEKTVQWNLIILRKAANLSQRQIAEMIGISTSAYSRKESGKSQFDSEEMFKIRAIFKKPIDEIFLPYECIENEIEEMREAK